MKAHILITIAVLLLTVFANADPGDTIDSFVLSGSPANGVRGLDKDWDDGGIWAAGPNNSYQIYYGKFDPATHTMTESWATADSSVYWCFDIGYGYDDGGTTSLLIVDQNSPYIKIVDPSDGSVSGSLPDHYSSANYTDGASVDWDTNEVYSSSYGDSNLIYYDSAWNVYDTPGNRNMGCAVGWGKIFIVRTDSYYQILVYDLATRTLEDTINLNSWSSYLMGIACGQENVVGDNESVFIATFYPSNNIYEVEVGDYTAPVSIKSASLGEIKASFK